MEGAEQTNVCDERGLSKQALSKAEIKFMVLFLQVFV